LIQRPCHSGCVVQIRIVRISVLKRPAAARHNSGQFIAPVAWLVQNLLFNQPIQCFQIPAPDRWLDLPAMPGWSTPYPRPAMYRADTRCARLRRPAIRATRYGIAPDWGDHRHSPSKRQCFMRIDHGWKNRTNTAFAIQDAQASRRSALYGSNIAGLICGTLRLHTRQNTLNQHEKARFKNVIRWWKIILFLFRRAR
jgi:hypothetical protein